MAKRALRIQRNASMTPRRAWRPAAAAGVALVAVLVASSAMVSAQKKKMTEAPTTRTSK